VFLGAFLLSGTALMVPTSANLLFREAFLLSGTAIPELRTTNSKIKALKPEF